MREHVLSISMLAFSATVVLHPVSAAQRSAELVDNPLPANSHAEPAIFREPGAAIEILKINSEFGRVIQAISVGRRGSIVIETSEAAAGKEFCLQRSSEFETYRSPECRVSRHGGESLVFDAFHEVVETPAFVLSTRDRSNSLVRLAEIHFNTSGIWLSYAQATSGEISFSWPPPQPAARTVLDRHVFNGDSTLGDAAVRIESSLGEAGYVDYGYYSIPGGFALATRAEQITPDGTPLGGSSRWSDEFVPVNAFDLWALANAVVFAPRGDYRVIVFFVTNRSFSSGNESVTRDEMKNWFARGANKIPNAVARMPFRSNVTCTVAVYHVRQIGHDRPPIINPADSPTGSEHLYRSGIKFNTGAVK